MWNIYDWSIFKELKYKPKCLTCLYGKKGLQTICLKYTKIPSDIQNGKRCIKYEEYKG